MYKFMTSRAWRLSVALILVFTLLPLTASAQEPRPDVEEAGTAEMGPPTYVELEWTDEPPTLTEEQRANLAYWAKRSHLPGPPLAGEAVESAGPVPGTESALAETRIRSGEPMASGDAQIFHLKQFGGTFPAGSMSNAMGSSVSTAGRYTFMTGNWFASRNTGWWKWFYVDPTADFADFCCDQISIYDEARDIFLWLRTGAPDGNGENVFKLGVSADGAETWYMYDPGTAPTDVNAGWTNERWADPHIQLGADYAYIAWNLYDQSDNWTRSVMLRLPLDSLAANTGFSYEYYAASDWFTFVPVAGAYHTMYWASNWPSGAPQNSRLRIWRWDEDKDYTTISAWTKTISAWEFTQAGDAQCGASGRNWVAAADQRLLTGARYSINSDGVVDDRILGRKVLGWWWNVKQGGGFDYPYIEGAVFFEDTMDQVPGLLGRPYIYQNDNVEPPDPGRCFAYPSAAPNKRQDLGMVFNYAEATRWRPNVAYSIADDYVWAPPGWVWYEIKLSRGWPSDEVWGGWSTVRAFEPTQKVWIAGAHIIPTWDDCTDCSAPLYVVFGRERDYQSWPRWR